jgi:hypothetical protein
VKDLTVFKNRQLKNMVLIDNAAYSYSLQLDNGIPIMPFYNCKKDTELKELAHVFLMELAEVEDVQTCPQGQVQEQLHRRELEEYEHPISKTIWHLNANYTENLIKNGSHGQRVCLASPTQARLLASR